jgi:hypothetical protein
MSVGPATDALHGRSRFLCATASHRRQKPESGECSVWNGEPATHLMTSLRQHRPKGYRVFGHDPACDGLLGHDHQSPDRSRFPSTLPRQELRHDATLLIQCSKQLLDVEEAGLDLDDEQCVKRDMPGDGVNRTSIAVVVEGVLRDRLPPHRPQMAQHRLYQPRVSLVQEPRDVACAHARSELDRHLDRIGDRADDV